MPLARPLQEITSAFPRVKTWYYRRPMPKTSEQESIRLDEAARAGWLYYIAGNTQDEIASKLGVSRQTAQRLVSLAVSRRLIKVRLDHPIANACSCPSG